MQPKNVSIFNASSFGMSFAASLIVLGARRNVLLIDDGVPHGFYY